MFRGGVNSVYRRGVVFCGGVRVFRGVTEVLRGETRAPRVGSESIYEWDGVCRDGTGVFSGRRESAQELDESV